MVEKKTTTKKPRAARKETPAKKETAVKEKPAPAPAKLDLVVKEKVTPVKHTGRYIYAVGRRKTATARIKFYPGEGNITVNNKAFKDYFSWAPWQKDTLQPLTVVGAEKAVDVTAVVSGGGIHSQAQALSLALARALVIKDETYRKVLKTQGLLTRDPREKERKKPGLKKARRAPQWSKR